VCPTYTLYDMEPDGSDIICVSFHETHEWQPSVNNEGMLAYTRWDYVDRDTNIAHHIWTSYPDGRDPRSFHGNYPSRRQSRPWMEMSIRAIPDSHKYVATTGAHHGNAFGSLVLIDSHVEDDGAMSQLTRLTPDVPFPEAEGKPERKYMCYATAWPLSEEDYLCVYDAAAGNRGIYWIDCYGNKELIYRDPAISSMYPLPIRSRPKPPTYPDTVTFSGPQTGRFLVQDVYQGLKGVPHGTVKRLRVIGAPPKVQPHMNSPVLGVSAEDLGKFVLGTVPVEEDGSAYFHVPSGISVFFQALDERGLALQTMRSLTYVQPNQTLTCIGCHEHRDLAPTAHQFPLAAAREPSKL
ncbi:hypothetical protein LCGC14_3075140, partial [marine sediment metagenome]